VGASTGKNGLKCLARFLGRLNMAIILLEEASYYAAAQYMLEDEANLAFFFSPGNDEQLREMVNGNNNVATELDEIIAYEMCRYVAQLVRFVMTKVSGLPISTIDTSSKMRMLFYVLETLQIRAASDFRGIIFCDTKAATYKIVEALKQRTGLRDLSPRYFVGHGRTLIEERDKFRTMSMTDSQQRACLDDFRHGRTRLLVATSVAEEGLDIPICSLVIRYEGSFSVQSFIQSRGRARKLGANFVVISKLSGENPFRKVLADIDTQDQVIREIMGEDQTAIINGRSEPTERAAWEADPRIYLHIFAVKHGVRVVAELASAGINGVQITKYVDIDYDGSGTKKRLIGVGLGSERNATQVAEYNLCKELFRLGLLPSTAEDVPRAALHHAERQKFSYLHSDTVAMTESNAVRFASLEDASTAPVVSFDPREWTGAALPYELLLKEVTSKKLPYDNVRMSVQSVDNGTKIQVTIVFPTRTLQGEVLLKKVEYVAADLAVAQHTAALAALSELGRKFVRRTPGSV
jgi:hypothetical protein